MSWKSLVSRVVRIGVREGVKYYKDSQRKKSGLQGSEPRPSGPPQGDGRSSGSASAKGGDYPGDYRGAVNVSYAPDLDGDADPGEVVWGWIPFEEDHSQGKDRPSLVVGKDGRWVLALMLTSKDHIPGGVGEVREDRHAKWMNIGSGEWDSQGRPSEIRLDRVIRLDPETIRREGSIMPREIFEQVANNVNAG
ncbi:MAG: type II toxin-antitoxin system PemK/MazF family toxin [Brevibacterium aurantiacum]|uniref:type II toxin-antitoxin system PemK/MazF family toxin n=1 Tax=Brevibacterium aurantiacum TaxID=273384 RepID=UPI003F91F9C7